MCHKSVRVRLVARRLGESALYAAGDYHIQLWRSGDGVGGPTNIYTMIHEEANYLPTTEIL